MIRVVYCREKNQLTVTGHAHSGQYGHDLVCAAVSALTLTLCANVVRLEEAGAVTAPVMQLEPGHGEIRCRAGKDRREQVRQVFQCICAGYEVLATQWPEHVSYEVRGL